MVLIGLKNGEVISAHEAIKGTYSCVVCKNKLFYVSQSERSISHFRHERECEYSKKVRDNYEFYVSDFHIKWTRGIVKAKYLYQYWGNKEIADVINKKGDKIVVRNNLIKYSDYINSNVIWILNGDNRVGDVYKILYDNGEEEYIYKIDKRYDLEIIPKHHKIYIDTGKSELIEILDITKDKIECNIIKIDDFIDLYYEGIIYKEQEYVDIEIEKKIIFGVKKLEEEVREINEKINNKIIEIKTLKANFYKDLQEYKECYDIKTKKIKVVVFINGENYYILKDNVNYDIYFFEKIIDLLIENKKYKNDKDGTQMYFNIREKCEKCNELKYKCNIENLKLLKIDVNKIIKKEEIENILGNYCKISDTKKEKNMMSKKISFDRLLDHYINLKERPEYLYNLIDKIKRESNIESEENKYCYYCVVEEINRKNLINKYNRECLNCKENMIKKYEEIGKLINLDTYCDDYEKLLMKKIHKDCYKEYILKNENIKCLICDDNYLDINADIDDYKSSKKFLMEKYHNKCYKKLLEIEKRSIIIKELINNFMVRKERVEIKKDCFICKQSMSQIKLLNLTELNKLKYQTDIAIIKMFHKDCYKDNLINRRKCIDCNKNLLNKSQTIEEIEQEYKLTDINLIEKYHEDCYKKYLLKTNSKDCLVCNEKILNMSNKINDIKKINNITEMMRLFHNNCYEKYFKSCRLCYKQLDDNIVQKYNYAIKLLDKFHKECYIDNLLKDKCEVCNNTILDDSQDIEGIIFTNYDKIDMMEKYHNKCYKKYCKS